jgi:predicted nuclease with TOPRIM domain
MRHELLELYKMSNETKDRDVIRAFQQARDRIGPQIAVDLILENEELRAELEKLKRQWAEDDRDITALEDENNKLLDELTAEREKVSALEIKVNNQQDWFVEWRKCEEALEGRA